MLMLLKPPLIRCLLAIVFALPALSLLSPLSADSGRDVLKLQGDRSSGKEPSAISSRSAPASPPGQETAVMAFVGQHHPELTELLIQLKQNRPKDYQRAIRDLSRTSDRLAQLEQRDSERYELELRAWKLQSRVELLAARLTMNNDDALREQLKALLDEKIDLRIASLQRDREKLAARLKRIDEQLEKLANSRGRMAEQQLHTLIQRPPK